MRVTLLTNGQLQALTEDEIRERLNVNAKAIYGDNVNTNDNSIVGMDNGILTILVHDIMELLQTTNWANHLLSASGKDLDRFGQDDGIPRKSSSPATVQLKIAGEAGTEIPEGSQFTTNENLLFYTTENAKIGADGTIMVDAVSDTEGAENNVLPNTITLEVDVIDGIDSVTNPIGAQGGADEETDIAYQARLYNERVHPKNGSEDGIKSYLENEVAGVRQVKVISNRSMQSDKYGNPPKSTHIYVLGGANHDIAQGIFEIVPAPAYTVGQIHEVVANLSGDARDVYFDRATTKPVFVKIGISTNFNFNTETGANDIRKKIRDCFSLLEMGDTVLFSKLYEYIWQVDGLKSVDVQLGLEPDKLELKDIPINEFELAVIDDTNIEVAINV